MSFQAVTWAIEQRAGNPSAKAVLWSIANYANEYWCSYPKQDTIAGDSEQSIDSVGKRVADLIALGLLRRIKLKRFGRRTHDFLILAPSPLFEADEAAIGPHLPSGCEIMADQIVSTLAAQEASADCGSVSEEKTALEREDTPLRAAADCGSVENTEIAATLPQPAAHATALVREHESVLNQDSPPKPPSNPGEAQSGLSSREGAATEAVPEPIGFATFWSEYPDHQLDNRRRAADEFTKLTDTDRVKATDAVRLYARDIRDRKRRPVAAARWLRDRRFSEYAPGAARTAIGRVFVPEGSDAWQAWCAVASLAFGGGQKIPTFWAGRGPHGERGANCPAPWPLGGDGWLVPFEHWVFVARDTAQFHRWSERVHEILGRGVMIQSGFASRHAGCRLIAKGGATWSDLPNVEGIRVPSEWPPAKGERVAISASPELGALTEEDSDALIDMK